MVRHLITTAPAADEPAVLDVPGPIEASKFDTDRLRATVRTLLAGIDRSADLPTRIAAIERRLGRVSLTKHHRESGIAVTMALDFTLRAVHLPEPLDSDQACRDAETVLSGLTSTLHRAVSAATRSVMGDMAAVVRSGSGHG